VHNNIEKEMITLMVRQREREIFLLYYRFQLNLDELKAAIGGALSEPMIVNSFIDACHVQTRIHQKESGGYPTIDAPQTDAAIPTANHERRFIFDKQAVDNRFSRSIDHHATAFGFPNL
jgi:hypothetical protein